MNETADRNEASCRTFVELYGSSSKKLKETTFTKQQVDSIMHKAKHELPFYYKRRFQRVLLTAMFLLTCAFSVLYLFGLMFNQGDEE